MQAVSQRAETGRQYGARLHTALPQRIVCMVFAARYAVSLSFAKNA